MPYKSDTLDAEVARIAARQHHRIHRGVYAVGHSGLSLHGRFMAAVLACGEGAVLSHGSAAVLWKLLRPLGGPVHVSIPTTSGRKKRSGIHLHRTQALPTTRRDDIPVTTVPRTIEDLEGWLPPHLHRRARRQAELMGHRLEGVESDRTRSDLETLFLALCRRYGIPDPEVNVKLDRQLEGEPERVAADIARAVRL